MRAPQLRDRLCTMETPLIIDVREACRPNRTGKGQWTFGLVAELLRRRTPVTLLTDSVVHPGWNEAWRSAVRIPGAGFRWHWNALRWLKKRPATIYVSPTSYVIPALAPPHMRCVTVIHDLVAFRKEPHDRKATIIERLTLPRVVRVRKQLCTTSESTKQDLLARYPEIDPATITPIFAGPSHPHPKPCNPDGKTILCIATLCPRKNQMRLIEAFSLLPPDLRNTHRLILAGGRGWNDGQIIHAARNTHGVEWLGYVDDGLYNTLLETCTVFALPSLYEGFGMQILDALQRGISVVTSDMGSLRELAKGAAMIVNPEDAGLIARGLETLLREWNMRQELAAKGRLRAALYSWSRTADLLLSHAGNVS